MSAQLSSDIQINVIAMGIACDQTGHGNAPHTSHMKNKPIGRKAVRAGL
jgi:hypothetical protein